MSIIYDSRNNKISQNGFYVSNPEENEFTRAAIELDGERVTISKVTDAFINPLDPIYDVRGSSKEEFIEKLSALDMCKVSIIEKKDEYIRFSVGFTEFDISSNDEFRMQYLKLVNSLSGSIQIIPIQ